MSNSNKVKKDKIIDKKSGMEDLESFYQKKKNQNRILGKLLNNLNSDHIKKK
jgi:hypothetical protein